MAMHPTRFMEVINSDRLWIKPKDGGEMKFEPSRHQQKLFDKIVFNRTVAMKPTRLCYVKCRQCWITTGAAAFQYSDAVSNVNCDAVVALYDSEGKDLVWDIYDRFITTDTQKQNPRYLNRGFWKSEQTGSKIKISLAKDKLGRGGAIMNAHFSEVDFWEDFIGTLSSLMPSLSKSTHSVCILETTLGERQATDFRDWIEDIAANGEDDPDNDWEIVFIGWLDFPEQYEHEVSEERAAEIMDTLDEVKVFKGEKELVENLGATPGQISWRRWCIKTEMFSNLQKFKEEYPATLKEALAPKQATVYFRKPALDYYEENIVPPIMRVQLGTDVDGQWWQSSEKDPSENAIEIWQQPIAGCDYTIGADSAHGIEDERNSKSSFHILESDTGAMVASYAAFVDTYEFASILYAACSIFNGAFAVIENNNMGHAVIQRLVKDLHYGNLYTQESFDSVKNLPIYKYGYKTDEPSREVLLSQSKMYVDQKRVNLLCPHTLRQLRLYSNFRTKAKRQKNKVRDDRVLSLSLAILGCRNKDAWIPKDAIPTPRQLDKASTVAKAKNRGYTFEDWEEEFGSNKKKKRRGYANMLGTKRGDVNGTRQRNIWR